ncbi:MAG: hypothetical protein ACJ79S_03665 [Gemmatimonadaceae bacterium]
MLVAPEIASLLHTPSVGGAARALCGALRTPDVHSATLRETLAAFVRQARAQAIPLAELTHTLRILVRDLAKLPPHDRPGMAEFLVRHATLLYES